jgi:hypothetical protein
MFLSTNIGTSEVKVLLQTDAGETRLAGSGGAPARACRWTWTTAAFDAEGRQM